MQKRGLSGVVTIILIILLVLVAVGIIWSAVRGPIEETGDKIGADCLTLDVTPTSCGPGNIGIGSYDVSFIRNAGAGSMSDVKVIFYDKDGNTEVKDYGKGLGEFETGSIKDVVLSNGFSVTSFNVAAVYQPGDTPIACEIPENRAPVDCSGGP